MSRVLVIGGYGFYGSKVTATLREGLAFVLRHRAPDLAPIDLDELDRIYREAQGQRPDRVRIAR